MKFTFPPESKPLDGYTIKRAIHRGGFGEVYYALSDGGKEVALKLLQQHLDVELRGIRQCLNLKHPNLVSIFDVRTDEEGDHWIVMEYVSGKSLAEVIDSGDPLPVEEIEAWLAGIAAGLNYLHDRGIVHRDLKPANVYRDAGTVKIGDVGLSKFISESRRSAQTESVGTVYYMAPEVAHGRYGREVDVYSLGVMLYEMLTGRVPFDGESTGEILMKHLTEKPDLAAVPDYLRPVLARALEKDPLKRTASPAELLEGFRAAVRDGRPAVDIPDEAFTNASDREPAAAAPYRPRGRNSGAITEVYDSGRNIRREAKRAARELRHKARRAYREAQAAKKEARHRRRAERIRARRSPAVSEKPGFSSGEFGYAAGDGQPRHGSHRPNGARVGASAGSGKGKQSDSQTAFWLKVAAVALVLWVLFAPRVLFGTFRGLFIGAIFAALAYGIYRLVAYLTTPLPSTPTPAPVASRDPPPSPLPKKPADDAAQPVAVAVGRKKSKPRTYGPETLRSIPLRFRMADLTGALTYAVLATALVTAGFWAVLPSAFLGADAGAIGLFSLVTLLASWAALVPAKLWEGTRTEPHVRRLTQLAVGALVGAAAFWLHQNLMVDVGYDLWGSGGGSYALFDEVGTRRLVSPAGQPTLAAFMVFFGTLFFTRRWWRHCDAFRKRRIRFGSLLLTGLVGFVAPMVLAFPHLWGMMWALGSSVVVQLSAAWVAPEERRRLMEGSTNATDA